MSVKPLPVYQYAVVKESGVSGSAHEFLSVFNPAGSGVVMLALGLVVESYSLAATTSDEPLRLFRTSATSGGTLITAATITRFDPLHDAPKCVTRVSGPAVTKTGLELLGVGPVVSVGTGSSGSTFAPPPGVGAKIYPGTGITFGTLGGDTDQRWNIQFTWGEAS